MGPTTLAATFAAMNSLHDIWQRDQRPVWESVLLEAELKGEEKRAEYARWILTEVLGVDPPEPVDVTSSVSQETEKGPARLF